MKAGFICSNYYGFHAFRRLLRHPDIEPVFVVGLDERKFADSGLRPFYYQGSRYFAYGLSAGVDSYLTSSLAADETLVRTLAVKAPEVVFAMGWPDILPPSTFCIARLGIIGVHPSSLPDYRGGAPLNWQLIDGRAEIGVTSFFFSARLDAGNILSRRSYQVPEGINVAGFIEDVYEEATLQVLLDALAVVKDGREGAAMDVSRGFVRRRRTPADGAIVFDRPMKEVIDFVHAQCFPFPGAFFEHEGRRFIVNRADRAEGRAHPGEVIDVSDHHLVVGCADGAVRLSGIVAQEVRMRAAIARRSILGRQDSGQEVHDR